MFFSFSEALNLKKTKHSRNPRQRTYTTNILITAQFIELQFSIMESPLLNINLTIVLKPQRWHYSTVDELKKQKSKAIYT